MSRRAQTDEAIPTGAPGEDAARIVRQLDRLEGLVEQLKVAFQRFFNGDLALAECQKLQDQIGIGLRALRHTKIQRSEDRFRLGTIEARIHSYSEMFHRRVRSIEEGRLPERSRSPASPPQFDVEQGVILAEDASEGAVAALFQGLQDRTGRAPTADLDSFRSYLEQQMSAIRTKTGCGAVQFRLVSEEGKIKLKARPVKADAPAT